MNTFTNSNSKVSRIFSACMKLLNRPQKTYGKLFWQKVTVASLFLLLFLPSISEALTPIARWDVVPYQRINAGETFNIGVIAFSKAGIDRVVFTVSGQGYSGQNPMQSSNMTHNTRTDVYEYWVPLKGSDFATDGPFTVQAQVYGKDGGSRDLGTLPLIINATGNLPQPKAWVSPSGSDVTGALGNSLKPFSTLGGAVSAIQSVNSGRSDGGIIYLMEGVYNLGNGSTTTMNEWLTITKAPNATKEATIINASGDIRLTNLLKVEGLTLQSRGTDQYVFMAGAPANLWVDDCRLIGSGRWLVNSNPVHHSTLTHYSTNNHIYDCDYAFRKAGLVRGVKMELIGNDALENTPFAVNCILDDINNGPNPAWHADAYQTFTGPSAPPPDNRIIYNYKATSVHYEGMFMATPAGVATDNAFVNVFMELREPASKNESDLYAFMSLSISDSWDHLLIWNCSFLNGHSAITGTFTNSSFIGNIFYMYVDARSAIGTSTLPYAVPDNTANNEFLNNHYMNVYGETQACIPNSRFIDRNWPCPHWYAKKPDTASEGSATISENVIDLTDSTSVNFGMPLPGSVIIDRLSSPIIAIDVYGNPRDQKPDIGAMESVSIFPPNNFRGNMNPVQ